MVLLRLAMGALLALAVWAMGWSPVRAQCPVTVDASPPEINIHVPDPKIVYHHDVDLFGLPKLEHYSERPPSGSVLLGLTQIADAFTAQSSFTLYPLASGKFCVAVRRIDAVLGNPVMNVYVADEYPPDSCEYNVILAHENTHVRFNLETLRDWLPTVKAALTEAAKHKFPAVFPHKPDGHEMEQYLLSNMQATFTLMGEDMARRNATIDTPENYRRENAKCHNWSREGFKLDR
jgi:hypothetical protein